MKKTTTKNNSAYLFEIKDSDKDTEKNIYNTLKKSSLNNIPKLDLDKMKINTKLN